MKSVVGRTFARTGSICCRSAAFLAVSLLAAGCAVFHQEVDDGYSGDALAAQSTAGGVPLQVDGSVSGLSGNPLAALVGGAMAASAGGSALRYTPCNPDCAGDRIVWTFGPPAARPVTAYPAAFHVPLEWFDNGQPSATNVSAEVALFQGSRVVASASGQVDAPEGANDPAFKAMIAEMSHAILSGPNWIE